MLAYGIRSMTDVLLQLVLLQSHSHYACFPGSSRRRSSLHLPLNYGLLEQATALKTTAISPWLM